MFDQIFILNCAAVKFEIDNTLRICISVQAVYVLFFFFFPESIRFIKRNFKLLYVKFGREERERIRILRLSFTIIDDFDPLDSAASS